MFTSNGKSHPRRSVEARQQRYCCQLRRMCWCRSADCAAWHLLWSQRDRLARASRPRRSRQHRETACHTRNSRAIDSSVASHQRAHGSMTARCSVCANRRDGWRREPASFAAFAASSPPRARPLPPAGEVLSPQSPPELWRRPARSSQPPHGSSARSARLDRSSPARTAPARRAIGSAPARACRPVACAGAERIRGEREREALIRYRVPARRRSRT